MLKFLVFNNGQPAEDWPLHHAQLIGTDDIGIHAEVELAEGVITCRKAALGTAALLLQVELEQVGQLMLSTTLLPEREEPYLLMVELARHRIMRCFGKQEDWAMFDLPRSSPASEELVEARQTFVEALSAMDDPVQADALGRKALIQAITASEDLALAHAEGLIRRRWRYGQLSGNVFGVGVRSDARSEPLCQTLSQQFNFVRLPTTWRSIEPAEQEYEWDALDDWCEWCSENRMPLLAGPLISFTPAEVPDWLYIWENDYETLRDLVQEHVERIVTRYRGMVSAWIPLSGIHVNDHFSFNFEQLMDLTRLTVSLLREIHPTGRSIIEITQPFGEYYGWNQRSIPPVMYAEMVLQSGIEFDAFGIKLLMGQPKMGQWTRDLMQISTMLDRFNNLSRPLHVTAVAAPSEPVEAPDVDSASREDDTDAWLLDESDESAAIHHEPFAPPAGYWREPWSPEIQALWAESVYRVILSKPFVESVSWLQLADDEGSEMPVGGLMNGELSSKDAFERLSELRRSIEQED